MPDRWSQLERNRNRKPDDPYGQHLNRDRGQAPSTGRNSERMEQWRGGRKKGMGRRGKKKRQEEKRVKKQRRTNEEERRQELRRRPALARRAEAKITAIARFCEQGFVISAHKKGTKPYSPHVFTKDGLVEKRQTSYRINAATGRMQKVEWEPMKIRPWAEMHSRFLRKILRSAWAPKEPKTVLDQLVVATGGYEVEIDEVG